YSIVFFSSRRRHTRSYGDWSSDVCSSDLLDEKFQQIVLGIEQVMKEDEEAEQNLDLEEKLEESPITSEKIADTVKKLEERLERDPKNKHLKKAKRQLEKDLLPRKQKYEEQKAIFGERNSFSKTDTDATFMRMKENHTHCEEEEIVALIKYNTFDKEQTKAWRQQVGRVENMTYDDELDEWICSNGKRLIFQSMSRRKSDNGYDSIKRTYRCTECN